MSTCFPMNMADNSSTESPTIPFGPPTMLDIVLPPLVFIGIIVIAMFILSISTQHRWWCRFCCSNKHKRRISNNVVLVEPCKDGATKLYIQANGDGFEKQIPNIKKHDQIHENYPSTIFNNCDKHVLEKFKQFQNNPFALLEIALPVLISLIFCPVTIITYGPLIEFFWPKEITGGMPKINDVVSAFLMPAGLVYAIAFGFAYQDVLMKRENIRVCLENQMTLLRQIWELTTCSTIISKEQKFAIGSFIKDVMICWMANMTNVKSVELQSKGTLWNIISSLQQVQRQTSGSGGTSANHGAYDDNILDSLFSHIVQLDVTIHNECKSNHRSISVLQWLFLECLGFISFFGIIMIKADSYRLELTMCMLTVFSISAFSYILADLDSPYHGTFRIDLEPYTEFVEKLDNDCTTMLSVTKMQKDSHQGDN